VSNKEFAEYVIETLRNGDELTLEQIERLESLLKSAASEPEATPSLFGHAPCRCRELRKLLERVLDEGWSSLPLAAKIRKELGK
jgi:hypothetical protein